MLKGQSKRLFGLTFSLASLLSTAPARAADTMELFYHPSRIGVSYLVRGMGYNNSEGAFISLAGEQILSSRVVVEFTPDPGVDITWLRMEFAVPTIDGRATDFVVQGSDMAEITPGTWRYEHWTTLYNGTIHDGRFGWSTFGLTPDGAAITLEGTLSVDTGYYFTVSSPVPELSTSMLLVAGLTAVSIGSRRRRSCGEALAAADDLR